MGKELAGEELALPPPSDFHIRLVAKLLSQGSLRNIVI